jgi:hypothetical protein
LFQNFRPDFNVIDPFLLILIQGERQSSSLGLLAVEIKFSRQYLLKRLYFLHHAFGSFLEDQLAVGIWVYVWVFYSDPFVFLSVIVPNTKLFLLLWLCRKA